MKMILMILSLSLMFSQQLQVGGNLKVTGEIDAQGQAIKNVGTPILTTDAVNAQYVNERTAGKGRIITIKCGWVAGDEMGSCDPPICPDGWTELISYNETTSAGVGGGGNEAGAVI